jgi:hypothetical protein
VNKELSKTIETIIKKTINKLGSSSEKETDDLMVAIFGAEDGEPLTGEDKKNEEKSILQKDDINRIRGRIEKIKVVKLEKLALNNQSWSENWQADLLRKSKVLEKIELYLVLKLII